MKADLVRSASAGATAARVLRWWHRNFFDGWINMLLAVGGIWLLATTLPGLWRWLVTESSVAPASYGDCLSAGGACWSFLQAKWRLILFGTYPFEEQWRAGLSTIIFLMAVVLSCIPGLWLGSTRRWFMCALWIAVLGTVMVLMPGGMFGLPRVEHRLWAGLPLTLGFAAIGCCCAFGLAILLALGRRSDMRLMHWLCVGYIEFIRGVPLISLLLLATILFPLLVPPEVDVDQLLRAQIAFVMFFAAYLAEAIRGGLQAVPPGQSAAAQAIGFGYWRTQIHIVLPQALRVALPSLVNTFIAALKDTSLVSVVAMMDLLGTANAAKADPNWWGLYIEPYLFVALIYFALCAGMSWYARGLERRLAGEKKGTQRA
ncbi:amino acid ABC transporter permease [Bradyrhizobium sp. Arg816]|uniref:amino acid ABC transporter permease n=1 Tax=Bradyrhizobium sp. Arg816 TaxID=2998491 RepID=UPI00249F0397|nr:amino acid ABC transporter permease [Bradyrhizobium sp. Arg816]MDI3567471.1 amino acid ABC transporter permease [Bradyrhizobium sp. Arg816]